MPTNTQDYSIYITGTGSKIINDVSSSFKYIHILNNSDFAIEVKGNGERILTLPSYTILPVPIPQSILATGRPSYEIIWTGTGNPATLRVIFANEVLFPGMTLSPPSGSSSVMIAGQSAGLSTEAKQTAMQNILAGIDNSIVDVVGNTGLLITGLDLLQGANTPVLLSLEMTTANTEYSMTLPAGTKKLMVMIRSNDASFRLAFEPGKVGGISPVEPYLNIPAGATYYVDRINLVAGGTIYVASISAGKIIQIECWK
jgi:hypothetical protein